MTNNPALTRRAQLTLGFALSLALLAGILVANYATSRWGFVPVGFGFAATAGTFAAGFTLALRDGIQDALGRRAVLVVIAAGTVLSFVVADPAIAVASGAAFLLAELLNFAIYTPLRNRSRFGDRRWGGAVVASNLAGAVADTAVFIGIAFGWAAILPAMAGQLVGKAWATLMYLIIGGVAGAVLRKPDQSARD